jgi:vacuolar-type H+-ATPase subunit B/Vma2
MVDVLSKEDKTFGDFSEQEEQKEIKKKDVEVLRTLEEKHALKRKLLQYYDKQQQLKLVLAT